jgi:hypothetical protein
MNACGRRAEHRSQQYARVDVLVHQPNCMGKLVGPLMPSNGFHGGDPMRRGFGKRRARISPASRRSPASSMPISSEKIFGQVSTPTRDHVVDVVVELAPRLEDDGLFLGEIAVEAHDLEDVLGPP